GTCVAFAITAALEHQIGVSASSGRRRGNSGTDLSEQHMFDSFMRSVNKDACNSEGFYVGKGCEVLKKNKICAESDWRYVSSMSGIKCRANVPVKAKKGARYGIRSFYHLKRKDGRLSCQDPEAIEGFLESGRPVVVAMLLPKNFIKAKRGETVDVVIKNGKPLDYEGGHAMVICGFDKKQRRFLLRNSWGKGWADRGYCWITYDFLKTYNYEAAVPVL
ncbi:MAG: C1 family peptidase, partial [Fibrobacterota bacterium]